MATQLLQSLVWSACVTALAVLVPELLFAVIDEIESRMS